MWGLHCELPQIKGKSWCSSLQLKVFYGKLLQRGFSLTRDLKLQKGLRAGREHAIQDCQFEIFGLESLHIWDLGALGFELS